MKRTNQNEAAHHQRRNHSVNRRGFTVALLLCAPLVVTSFARADDNPRLWTDPAGDAVIRRTDLGNDGSINPQSTLPDLTLIRIGGWETDTPLNNPYVGQWRDPRNADLLRVDIVFNGLVNPPGPLNLHGEGYDPYRYGQNPLYGFVEFDMDSSVNTGGEIDSVSVRPLGNVSRFGGRFMGPAGQNAARSGYDLDNNLNTNPAVERSGEEMHLQFCGCHSFTVNTLSDPTPNTFDSGDTWIVTGRFLARTFAFSPYSFAFGGSAPGEYDPVVSLLFQNDAQSHQTTITLIYGMNNDGAASLLGQQRQDIDLNAGNQTSVLEMLYEIQYDAWFGRDTGHGTGFDLLRNWADHDHDHPEDFLDARNWNVLALFGTTYSQEQSDAYYVWTDVGPQMKPGDFNGDGVVNATDRAILGKVIEKTDGGPYDKGGMTNGQTRLKNFGTNFALYDLNYDGVINVLDLRLMGGGIQGDVDCNGVVEQRDLVLLHSMLGFMQSNPDFNPAADIDGNGIIDQADQLWLYQYLHH